MKISISQIGSQEEPDRIKVPLGNKKNEEKKTAKKILVKGNESKAVKIVLNKSTIKKENKLNDSAKKKGKDFTEEIEEIKITNKETDEESIRMIKSKIELPDVQESPEETPIIEEAPKKIKNKNGLKTILIVEDEKPLSRALEIKLTKEGYEVSIANNGEDAINLLADKSFALIILDLVMPKKDGFAVLEFLKSKNKKTEIIVLSNLAQEEDFKKAKELGAKTYFIKSNTPIIELVNYIKENI